MTERMKPFNLSMPDDLKGRIERAALEASVERGKRVSVSEWVREACEAKLVAHKPKRPG